MALDKAFPIFPASKLGEYVVLRDIAEGTFGKVKSQGFSYAWLKL